MTEKSIFANKLFLSLNLSDFNLFLKNKKSPLFSQQHPTKSWCPVKPLAPFWKFGWRVNCPCRKGEGGGVQTMYFKQWHASNGIFIWTQWGYTSLLKQLYVPISGEPHKIVSIHPSVFVLHQKLHHLSIPSYHISLNY